MENKFKLVLILGFHLFLIFKSGYFLSPEFTLYPYLKDHGFLPYQNIIDQHLPIVLFGPFSLPSFLTTNPGSLLPLFLFITLIIDLLFYLTLLRQKSPQSLPSLLIWVCLGFYFGGNTFWLETFIVLCLALILFLSSSHRAWSKLIIGVLACFAFLIKPVILLPLLFLFLILKIKPNRYLFFGFLIPLSLTALYLVKFELLPPFFDLVFKFNKNQYLSLAAKFPTPRQLFELGLLALLFIRRRLLAVLTLALFLMPAFPRFEFSHLQPAIFLLAFLFMPKKRQTLLVLTSILLVLSLSKAFRHSYGNFYLDSASRTVAQYLSKNEANSVYILGGNDLIYPLSGKMPPGETYLPSLPWYLGVDTYQNKVIANLTIFFDTPVLVNYKATVDGQNIARSASRIIKYIENNYTIVDKVGGYDVFMRNFTAKGQSQL